MILRHRTTGLVIEEAEIKTAGHDLRNLRYRRLLRVDGIVRDLGTTRLYAGGYVSWPYEEEDWQEVES